MVDVDLGLSDKKKIVLCEDERLTAEMILDTLSDDFRMHWVSDATKAVGEIRAIKPDLVLTDMGMPGVGGYELVKALQTHDETKNIPVIFLTGRKLDDTTITMLKAEPNVKEFLLKPCSPRLIIEAIKKALG